jgi:hypothetical protein
MLGDGREALGVKIVAHLRGGKLVKGYTNTIPATDPKKLLQLESLELPAELEVTSEAGNVTLVERDALKALFFVRSFEGKNSYDEIKFFAAHPPIEGLWVRVKFTDGEVTEGVVRNSVRHLTDPGFLLKPPDPNCNNQAVYVIKQSLAEFRVLGVKSTF